ncbi:transglutaminase-like cysteine peptidase [Sneathiella marina]|uniref:Transglutaminase-like cysteine peptidase n=1 Tax=Sneathiella marina TaxID=2950108 RepID=A0ABY4W5N1_9PROT|nr:transglutaminase-like cysteine peptidase [Sneathiella marina]USG62317.1 transglutaminase-like cysteine peptidase [Sneathiella marina]
MRSFSRFSCLSIVTLSATLSLAPMKSAYADVNVDGLFGTVEIASDNLSALPQWKRVIESFEEVAIEAKKCDLKIEDCYSQQMTLWRAKINELRTSDKRVQIQQINRFLNSWRKRTDTENYAVSDYWATPLEFMENGGDSEDFAIMKYISLKELGVPPSDMRIVVTNDVLRNNVHTVLSVKTGGKIYILDDLNDSILSESFTPYYLPLYSVNEQNRWAHIPKAVSVEQASQGTTQND